MSTTTRSSSADPGKPTLRADGRWMKRFKGKTHYFRGSEVDALAWWRSTHQRLTTVSPGHAQVEAVVSLPLNSLSPTPENDEVYDPLDRTSQNYL